MSTKPNKTNLPYDAQQQYEQLVANIDGIIWELDTRTFRFTFVSRHAERLLGYPLEQWFRPGFWMNHLHPDDRDWALEFCQQATREKRNHDLEYRMITADGRTVWLQNFVSVVVEGDVVTRLRGIMVKITDHKRMKEALREKEELYRAVVEQITEGIAVYDAKTRRVLESNAAFQNLLGYTAEEARTLTVYDIVAHDHENVDQTFQGVITKKHHFISERRYRRKDGSLIDVEARANLISYGGREVVCSVVHDITERKRTEVALRASEERFRALIENSWDGITLVSAEGKILYSSPANERLWGYRADELIGATGFELVYPDDQARVLAQFGELVQKPGDIVNAQYRIRHKDGSWRWVEGIARNLLDEPNVQAIVVNARDITDHKRAEEERQAHLWFLESLDQVNRAMQGTNDLKQMMSEVLDAVLTIFDCDRAWLIYPCDPEATLWYAPMERTRVEYSSALALGLDVPIDPELVKVFQTARTSSGPLQFGSGSAYPLPAGIMKQFGVQSMIVMAIYPKVDKPYLFGLHQCSYPRVWTPREERLFQEIGRRLTDALTSLLMFHRLRESERKLEAAQRMAHIGYWTRDFDADRITLSDETCRIFGLPEQERFPNLAQWHERWLELIHPEDRPRVAQAAVEALRGGPRYDVEYRVIRPNGEVRIVHSQGDITWDEWGRPRRMFGIMQDITELRQAEYELRASEARFRTLVDHATDAFFLHDDRGTILDVNRQACESLGYTREELIGMTPADFDVDSNRSFLGQLGARLDAGEMVAFDTRHRRKDRTIFPVEVRIRPFWQGGHRFGVSLVRDITNRKRAEQALVESHSLLNTIVEGTSDVIFIKDLQGRYLMINSAGARFFGKSVDEIIGKDDRELFTPNTACAIMEHDRQVIETGTFQVFEETATVAGVTRTYLSTKGIYRDAQGKVIGLIGIAHDVTELKRLEEQFRQAQKMEAVGRLAGGVAHDFNNLLTVINSYSELVFRRLRVDDPSRELLAQIQKAGERAANLTRQLLAFSRKQVLQPQVVNLNTLLKELHKLLQRLIGEDIELTLVVDPVLGLAKVDPGQFEQAIINLAVNARDAMPQGGRLIIETHNTELDEEYARRYPEVRSGRYVLVVVSDTGQGMDEATRARIFEPFFTTKGPGKGTGLGLAMVYGFVKQSGGHIEVSSEWGCGTTFKVYLPWTEEAIPSAKSSSELVKVPKGMETVLLVEDEDSLRSLVRLVLQSSGYLVLEARDGREAVRLAQQHPGPIHLLVTDLVMPGMSGRQLAELLAQAKPHMRILFMSGYTDEAVHGVVEAGVAFLQKPFNPMELARKVREVLDAEEDRRS